MRRTRDCSTLQMLRLTYLLTDVVSALSLADSMHAVQRRDVTDFSRWRRFRRSRDERVVSSVPSGTR